MKILERDLKKLSSQILRTQTREEVRKENEQTTRVLHHLREIDHRKLWAEWGFKDLKDYCMKELGYTDQAARRRIDAMVLLQAMPEYEEKVQSGELSMSVIAQAQSFIRQEELGAVPIPQEKQKEIIENLQGKSTRQADRLMMSYSSRPAPQVKEGIRAVSQTHSEVKFVADDELLEDLEKIRGLLSNKTGPLSLEQLFREMAKIALQVLDPALKKSRSPKATKPTQTVTPPAPESSSSESASTSTSASASATDADSESSPAPAIHSQDEKRPYIPRALVHELYRRDHSQCSWIADPKTGRRCGSRYRLQIDHIEPFAIGGPTVLSNLRLLCWHHNQVAAIQAFGIRKMEKCWKRTG